MGGGLTQHAFAKNAQRAAVQILDRVIEKAKLLLFLPAAIEYVIAVGDQVAAQGKNQGERMFRHGVNRIVANIGHRDTAFTTRLHIHHVIAGSGHGDQFEVGQLRQGFATDGHFVADCNRCPLQTLDHVFGSGLHMLDPFMRKSRCAQLSP